MLLDTCNVRRLSDVNQTTEYMEEIVENIVKIWTYFTYFILKINKY